MSTPASVLSQRDATFAGCATKIEWPTVALGTVIVGLYVIVTLSHDRLPTVVLVAALGLLAGWWSGFQHELIHGHPFPSDGVNEAIGSFAMTFWIPYRVYRQLHLRHHLGEALTDPTEDPESFYCDQDRWRDSSRLVRAVMWTNRTFVGRLVIGPPISVARFLGSELGKVARGEDSSRRDWCIHAFWVAVTGTWAFGIAGVPVWAYLLGTMWVGTSVIQIRSFAEHLYQPANENRTAFVDGVFPFGILFLFNNMHHAHHARPSVPWYQLPRLADHLGSREAAERGAGYYRGYRDVVRRYAVKPFCVPVHPATADGASLLAARYTPVTGSVGAG